MKIFRVTSPFWERTIDGLCIGARVWHIEGLKNDDKLFVRVTYGCDEKSVGRSSFQGTERDLEDWLDRVSFAMSHEPEQVEVCKRLAKKKGKTVSASELEEILTGLEVVRAPHGPRPSPRRETPQEWTGLKGY